MHHSHSTISTIGNGGYHMDSKTLEAYLIPAEEGFGSFLAGTAVVIGGLTLIGSIMNAADRKRITNTIIG